MMTNQEKKEDIKGTINWLLENGEFKDSETSYNSAMNTLNLVDEVFSLNVVMQSLIDLPINTIVVYNDKKPAMIIEELEHDFVNVRNEKGEIIKKHKSDLVKASINVP